MMKLPIGYDNFREILDNKLDFVDKSLFIKDVMDDATTKVSLITRPRRFGKTLNLSMLQHFLAAEVHGQKTTGLFDHLKIGQIDDGGYLKHQGRYPIIFISFKDIKDTDFVTAYNKMRELIISIYDEHNYLALSDRLSNNQRQLYQLIMTRQADRSQLQNSLQILCTCLYQHYNVKPWLLIDEYDTPIQSSYLHGYYDEMINFMRGMFGAALKTNPYLEKAVITGILRIAKESLFSGLNNLKVYSVLDERYGQYFGFTEEEMDELLQQADLTPHSAEIRKWYNGYQFGKTVVYNPWSVANCLNERGALSPYWVNTSDNALIKKLFAQADEDTKIKLESLVRNEPVTALVDEYIAFINVIQNSGALWSLLLSSGYLKAIACKPQEDQLQCDLLPPNFEVSLVYRRMVKDWLTDRIGQGQYDYFIGTLLKGNMEDFAEMLKKYLVETISVFDVSGKNPEKFYHGLVLGIISSTMKTHTIKSNRESGYGRYDVVIIPKDLTNSQAVSLILEFKVAKEGEELKASAHEALQQIEKRHYEAELKQAGITKIIKAGLAFSGKKVVVEWMK
ncbi:MAG: AAA family ATPase [Pseudomonadota bacterium]|mgnify:CR=1 FL=1